MSLFSRLEERMRARDTQDQPKEKENAAPPEEGGLFGAVRLGPPDAANVPAPSSGENAVVAREMLTREVPSIEEARAEFDRARAEFATVQLPREADSNDDSAPEESPARDDDSRESVSFGAVTLPPAPEIAAQPDALTGIFVPQRAVATESTEPGALPQNVASAPTEETAVYAPTPQNERESVARSEAQNAETATPAPAMESPRASESGAQTEGKSAPAARFGDNANLTPFQRLMAARAAQGGQPVTRSRIERPAPVAEATQTDSVIEEAPASEALAPEASAPEARIEAPQVETSAIETPLIEEPVAQVAQLEAPVVETSVAETSEVESAPTESAIEVPTSEVPTSEVSTSEVSPDETSVFDEILAVETEETSAVADGDDAETFVEISTVEPASTNNQPVVIEDVTSETALSETANPSEQKQTDETNSAAPEVSTDAAAPEIAPHDEAQTENEAAPQREEQSENTAPLVAPSLADRLASAPRAELEAAHAEAQDLAPASLSNDSAAAVATAQQNSLEETPTEEIKAESPVESPVEVAAQPSRVAVPVSFAERLAARKRVEDSGGDSSEAPARPTPPVAASPVAASEETPSKAVDLAPSMPAATSAPEAPPRPATRSFSERLAARTGLDRHLQVPAEEMPVAQDLATANAELARIDEGAQLSEREMKTRLMFRQKHLMFDAVVGAIDARLLQNPTRETVKAPIERGVDAAIREFNLSLESSERNWLVDEFVRELADLGALVPLLEDPSVSKIVVTGANDVSVERLGRIERTGLSFRDDDHLLSLVRRVAELSGGRVDAKVPILDRPLPDGGRIRAKVPPLAPQPTLTIEKATGNPFVALKRQMEEKSRGAALPYAQLRERIQQRLLREFEGDAAALAGDQDKLRGQVEEMIGSVIAEERVAVTRAERASLVMDLLNEIVGLGPIEPLLNDPEVDEVMVNGPYQIYVERRGKLELTSQRFRDNAHVMQVIDRIVAPLGRRVDEKSPMVDGRLRDGSRFNAIIPPLALSGPTMTIRKFARDPFTMSDLINFGSMTREAAQFLQAAVEGRLNIVVSGGTGSGKTTTLNVLSSFIPSSERIVTIEDAAELQMRQEHVIRMETRPPNIEGIGEIGIRDLVRNSLRMRPDRIVVGECRGGEALDMLQAMNTGHDGSLTTAHSNGPRDTCKRLETMVMMAGFDLPVRAIREQISMAVQLIVHQERMRDGKRRVTAITEIVGMEGDVLTLQDIFRFVQEGIDDDGRILGSLQATGMRPKYYETIVDNGVSLSMDLFSPKPHEAAPRARLGERTSAR